MNPFDMVRASAGDSMMPMVIFVIWVVISMFSASNKKKKRLQREAQRRTGPVSNQPAKGEGQDDTDGDIMRQIEVVLDDRQGQAEQSPVDDAIDDIAGIESGVPERAPAEIRQGIVSPAGIQAIDADESFGVIAVDSFDEVRKGVIWSEILAQPKALRE
ncbi:MAG: hypothetical protein MUF22_01925 [Chitinispirillaceae bacterium]|jgi:hypothetical protein|nr:hypothetical protein [Chitinispirillaceae bacterium]